MSHQRLSRYTVAAVAGALLLLTMEGRAQEERQQHTCTFDVAYSFAFPEGKDGKNFENARWGIQAGGGFALRRLVEPGHGNDYFVTANFMYEKFKATPSALENAQAFQAAQPVNSNLLMNATAAHGSFTAVTLDPTVRRSVKRWVWLSFYASGGFGWLQRGVSFNGANPQNLIQASGATLDKLHAQSGVFDIGGGANFSPWKNGTMLFLEGRVYRGLAVNSASTLVPLSLGIRW